MNRATMRAIRVEETGKPGDWNKLVVAEVPRPEPVEGEVLVQVEAFSATCPVGAQPRCALTCRQSRSRRGRRSHR